VFAIVLAALVGKPASCERPSMSPAKTIAGQSLTCIPCSGAGSHGHADSGRQRNSCWHRSLGAWHVAVCCWHADTYIVWRIMRVFHRCWPFRQAKRCSCGPQRPLWCAQQGVVFCTPAHGTLSVLFEALCHLCRCESIFAEMYSRPWSFRCGVACSRA